MGQKHLNWYQDVGFSITTMIMISSQQSGSVVSGVASQQKDPVFESRPWSLSTLRTACSPCICVGVFLVMQFPPPSVHVSFINLKSVPLTEAAGHMESFPANVLIVKGDGTNLLSVTSKQANQISSLTATNCTLVPNVGRSDFGDHRIMDGITELANKNGIYC